MNRILSFTIIVVHCLRLLQHIEAGERVLRIPLSIAITDHAGDEVSNKLIYNGAPWAVRLACKILREKAKGFSSPWHPYLQVIHPLQFAPPSIH